MNRGRVALLMLLFPALPASLRVAKTWVKSSDRELVADMYKSRMKDHDDKEKVAFNLSCCPSDKLLQMQMGNLGGIIVTAGEARKLPGQSGVGV